MDTPQPFERRRGALVMRPLAEWYAHQEFLRLRHCIGARVTLATRQGQRRHEGVIVAMRDDGRWVWASALSRVRCESSPHGKNDWRVTCAAPMVMVRIETTNGVGHPHDACPHHAVDITAVTPA